MSQLAASELSGPPRPYQLSSDTTGILKLTELHQDGFHPCPAGHILDLQTPSISSKLKRAPSVSDSDTRHTYCKKPVKEQSISSQESTNCADPQAVSDCGKNGESKLQSHVPSSVLSEPATNQVQDEIVPLSGNPYFTCILQKCHVQTPFQMVMPKDFCPLLPSASVPLVLSCQNKRWAMIYYGDRSLKRFGPGWRQFAIDNKLKIGDGCIFELMDSKDLEFRVRILSGQIPSGIASIGQSSDAPIVLD